MGTNFYRKGYIGNDNPDYHIGKRSAAGWYCWDCNVSLCKDGDSAVHTSTRDKWYDKCPICGKGIDKEDLNNSTVGRELGFNKSRPKRKTGVSSCCSFTWARDLGRIRKIQDEYGRHYTKEEFLEVLEECPIEFYKKGEWFS